jgi:hypothetical protein
MPPAASSSDLAALPDWLRGLAGVPLGVFSFAVLCAIGLGCVLGGVIFEIRRVRREGEASSAITGRGQFGWRMASALIWCCALGLLVFACSWGWPRRALGLGLDGRSWLQVLGVAMLLVLVGLMLLAQDLWRVRTRSRVQEEAFRQGLEALAQQEIERAHAQSASSSSSGAAGTSSTSVAPAVSAVPGLRPLERELERDSGRSDGKAGKTP